MRTLFAVLLTLVCCAGVPAASAAPARGSVTARWVPDVNWTHARSVTTHGSMALARRLRHDLAAAPRAPTGVMSCMIDTGAAARLTLPTRIGERHVTVRLTGCRTVIAEGQRARRLTPALRRDLSRIAPRRWRPYLTR